MSPIKLTEQLLKAFDTEKEAQEYIEKQKGFDRIAGNMFEYEVRPENYNEKEINIKMDRRVYRVIKHTAEVIE